MTRPAAPAAAPLVLSPGVTASPSAPPPPLPLAAAAACAPPGAMRQVTFGTGALPGFEAGSTSAPGVLLVQEWWGVTEIVKQQAELIAAEGFRVLVPDLYKGTVGVDME
ncbi:hypothetical protein TSOC_014366, partial [Tetrabaena socialis]